MSDDSFPALIVAVLIVLAGIGGCTAGRKALRTDAIINGAGEYYINTNGFSKEFRWKVCK